ncbi:MAG: DegT/DnrJ/EryC1/StrS family aminotransferase, partial [Chlamydiia bacterium]|nr:DegT/DnrJ/EryC1/StrS family aminotransferase [Chlamydiia bacterium]
MDTQGHKIQFIDLVKQYQHYKTEIHQAVDAVLESGAYILGPQVGQLEEALAEYANAKHCIAVGSGTDALTVALMALEVGPGDEVITSPFSFIAAVEAILLLGATPVFVDIDPQTYCLDPQQLEAAISPLTKAIIPVGLYGHMADMERITAIAAPHRIPVIEDAAQCYGGEQNGRKSCGVSELAITSFYPAKPLGGCGEAGAIFARDRDLAQKIRVIHNHGCSQKYVHTALGVNARCDTIQAAIL